MADVLFDTTYFIDYYRGEAGALHLMHQVRARELTAFFSPITVLELWVQQLGIIEEQVYQDLMAEIQEIPLTSALALLAASKLRAIGSRAGERLIRDALIGATAESRGATVIARNTRDFRRLNISLRTY